MSEQWYAIYATRDDVETSSGKLASKGELISTGTVVAAPLPAGMAKKEIDRQMIKGEMWDAVSHEIVQAPPRTLTPDEQMTKDLTEKDPLTWTEDEHKQATYLTLKKR